MATWWSPVALAIEASSNHISRLRGERPSIVLADERLRWHGPCAPFGAPRTPVSRVRREMQCVPVEIVQTLLRSAGVRAGALSLGLVLAASDVRVWAQDASKGKPPDSAGAAPSGPPSLLQSPSSAPSGAAAPVTMEQFLDRLMIAESGGRLFAKNPRSTALGPYQFIESTFLGVARRNFPSEVAGLTPEKILALRTDLSFSRRAAEAYTHENAAVLKGLDVEPTFAHLRLAFLLGPTGAAKVIKAPPDLPLASLLAPAVLIANPFMAAMTARTLIARSAREVNQAVGATDGIALPAGAAGGRREALPRVAIRCNLRLPSCKRWVALQTAKMRVKRGPRAGLATAVGAKARRGK